MKRIILSVAMLLTVGATALFANDLPGDTRAQENFKKQFAGAQFVKWSQEGDYTMASFVLGGNSAIALFNAEGEWLGSARDLVYNQLPLVVMTSLEKRFSNAVTIDAREVMNNEGTLYKLTIEHNSKTYKVTLYPDGGINEVKKVKK